MAFFQHLKEEIEKELTGNILPYWMKYTPDLENGGFYGHVTHFNQPLKKANKGAVQNARVLWTFAAAYRNYGNLAYLETARRANDYFEKHFLDLEFGGVYWELDYLGNVSADRKQIYAMAFAIYAMSEYWMVCGEKKALDISRSLFEDIEAFALDTERNGYTEALAKDWSPVEDLRLSDKDENQSKTMNTHLHLLEAYTNLLRIWKDPRLENALENIIMLFLDKFINPETDHLNLFFDDDWNLKSTFISYGHDIECSWLLHEAAEVLGKPALIERTGEVAINMARKNFMGLDTDGGLFYELFPVEKKCDSDKHWWPQAEALVGYCNAYQLSGDDEFAQKIFNCWNFIKDKIIDHQYGEWFWSVNQDGTPQTQKEKAGFWKCPYHNGRACLEMISRIEKILKEKSD